MHVADFSLCYSHRDFGMKDGSELMADMTTDASDVTAYDDDYLDHCGCGGADQVLAGLSLKHVVPNRCPESKRVVEGGKIRDFLRVNRACFNTGTCDVHWQVAWGAVCGWEFGRDNNGVLPPRNPSMLAD